MQIPEQEEIIQRLESGRISSGSWQGHPPPIPQEQPGMQWFWLVTINTDQPWKHESCLAGYEIVNVDGFIFRRKMRKLDGVQRKDSSPTAELVQENHLSTHVYAPDEPHKQREGSPTEQAAATAAEADEVQNPLQQADPLQPPSGQPLIAEASPQHDQMVQDEIQRTDMNETTAANSITFECEPKVDGSETLVEQSVSASILSNDAVDLLTQALQSGGSEGISESEKLVMLSQHLVQVNI